MQKTKNLFILSLHELKNVRTLTITALFIALNVTLDVLNIRVQITPDVRIAFGFLLNASIGMLFGPSVGMMAGVCTDVLGYLVNQGGGAYFPGYTLTAIVGGMLYGLWLYRKPVKWWRVLGAKASVNVICNIGFNTLWTALLYGKAIGVILPLRIVKNIVVLPFETILLYFVCRMVLEIAQRQHVLSPSESSK